MSALKWIVSGIIAILLISAAIGVAMFIVSISTFIFIGAGIIGALYLITYGIRSMWDSKTSKK